MNDYMTTTERPWGHFRMLDKGPDFVVKALLVKGEQRTSLQTHGGRAERWTVAMGVAIATVNGVKTHLGLGDTIHIPIGVAHRLANPAKDPLVVIEVWIGEDLSEDDIMRLEDDYGRVAPADGGVIPSLGAGAVLIGNGEAEHIISIEGSVGMPKVDIVTISVPIEDVQAEISATAKKIARDIGKKF